MSSVKAISCSVNDVGKTMKKYQFIIIFQLFDCVVKIIISLLFLIDPKGNLLGN